MAAAAEPQVAANPGEAGLHPFSDGLDALAARFILADAAERTLDVQYYIWKQDMAGRVLLERLLRAADRGVKVRILLDDFGTAPSDAVLLAINSHPNIELRIFNPITIRSLRAIGSSPTSAAPTVGCITSRSPPTGRSRSLADAISATNISRRVTATATPISIWQ